MKALTIRSGHVLAIGLAVHTIMTAYSIDASANDQEKPQIAKSLESHGKYALLKHEKASEGEQMLSFQEKEKPGELRLRLRQCLNKSDAIRAFTQARLSESTGGVPSDVQCGDQIVQFGSDRFLVQQGNRVYMVYGKGTERARVIDFMRSVEALYRTEASGPPGKPSGGQ